LPGAATTRCPSPFSRDLLRAAPILGQVIERNDRAGARERFDRGEPDTRGAAGDERGLSGEIGGDHGDVSPAVFAKCL